MLYLLRDVKVLLWKVIDRWKCFWIKEESGFFSSFPALHCSVASQRLCVSACDLGRLKGFLNIGVIATKNPVSMFHLSWKFLKEFLRNTATGLESPSHLSLGFPGAEMCSRGSCTHCGWWKSLPSWQDRSLEESKRIWHMPDCRLWDQSFCFSVCVNIRFVSRSFTKGN